MHLRWILGVTLICSSCTLQRSRNSGYSDTSSPQKTYRVGDRYSRDNSNESQKMAVEMGFDPATMSDEQMKQIQARKQLRDLERKLDSKREREQYAKTLPWLKSDEEKVEFLSLPGVENRQNWINQKKIWQRAQIPTQEFKELIDAQDIAIGMPMDYVRKAWGEPQVIENSGSPTFKNERWKYTRHVSTGEGFKQERRYVYFEGGRVVGWETE